MGSVRVIGKLTLGMKFDSMFHCYAGPRAQVLLELAACFGNM